MKRDLTKGSPFRTILLFSLPVIGGNLFQLFYTLADTVIVGQVMGADALAAVGATSTMVYLVLCFIQGFTSGFGIRLGQRYGAKDRPGMRRSIAASTLLSILLTIFITAVCFVFAHPILHWISTPTEIYDMAYNYMFVVLMGSGATIFYNMISNILRAFGDSKTPLIFLVASSLLNIVLDLILMVPFQMGVIGAALATVLSQLISAILCTIVALHKFHILRLNASDWRAGLSDFGSHLVIGMPMALQMSVMCIGQLAMQTAVNQLGTVAVAGYTAATKVDQMSVLVNGAYGIAASNYVAQNYGAGLWKRIREGVRACLIQLETANLLMAGLMLVCRSWIVALFVDSPTPEIISYATGYLTVVAPFYLLLGLLQVYRSAIQSVGNAAVPFIACIIELVMRMSAALGLSLIWGYAGICFATPLAWIGAIALLIPAYYLTLARHSENGNRKGGSGHPHRKKLKQPTPVAA